MSTIEYYVTPTARVDVQELSRILTKRKRKFMSVKNLLKLIFENEDLIEV